MLDGTVAGLDERGHLTIETFALNRENLVTARHRRLEVVRSLMTREPVNDIVAEVMADGAPIRRCRPPTARCTGGCHAEESANTPRAEGARRGVHRIVIDNFRAIEHLELDLAEDVGGWTMLLGENGDGKTTVLQALAVALMSPQQRRHLDARRFLRSGSSRGQIAVEFADGSGGTLIGFEADESRFWSTTSLHPVVAGYGAYRLSARNRRLPRYAANEPPRVRSVLTRTSSSLRQSPGCTTSRSTFSTQPPVRSSACYSTKTQCFKSGIKTSAWYATSVRCHSAS